MHDLRHRRGRGRGGVFGGGGQGDGEQRAGQREQASANMAVSPVARAILTPRGARWRCAGLARRPPVRPACAHCFPYRKPTPGPRLPGDRRPHVPTWRGAAARTDWIEGWPTNRKARPGRQHPRAGRGRVRRTSGSWCARPPARKPLDRGRRHRLNHKLRAGGHAGEREPRPHTDRWRYAAALRAVLYLNRRAEDCGTAVLPPAPPPGGRRRVCGNFVSPPAPLATRDRGALKALAACRRTPIARGTCASPIASNRLLLLPGPT